MLHVQQQWMNEQWKPLRAQRELSQSPFNFFPLNWNTWNYIKGCNMEYLYRYIDALMMMFAYNKYFFSLMLLSIIKPNYGGREKVKW